MVMTMEIRFEKNTTDKRRRLVPLSWDDIYRDCLEFVTRVSFGHFSSTVSVRIRRTLPIKAKQTNLWTE